MESSSSPTADKDYEKIQTTIAAVGADDEPTNTDDYPVSSPRNLFQEAVKVILRCLGFERENATTTQVADSGPGSLGDKETEGKENIKEDSSSSPQPKEVEKGGDQGQGDGDGQGEGAASVVSVLPQSSVAYDSPSTEAGDPPAAAASDDPPSPAQDDPPAAITTSLAFRRPTRPAVNPGQGGQTN